MASSTENGSLAPPRPSLRPELRRLSSQHVTRSDLYSGPTTIIPEARMHAPGEAHETALAMMMAKQHLADRGSGDVSPSDEEEPSISTRGTTPDADEPGLRTTDKYAFAFDIDGVLIRGGDVIPEAIEAMKVLNGENEYRIKIPYIFVTNGGGKTEEERCIQLSKQLELEVSPGQFICGHTPMREMAEKYKTVLVVGGEGEKCRHVAEGYGFQDVITPGDIIKTNTATTPFRTLTAEEEKNSKTRDFSQIDIEAVFVFADSRDWAGDQQIILDLCMSKNGRLGTRSETFDQGPPVYFAHNDVVWATNHEHTRIGMGALRASLEAMFRAITGKELHTIAFGKPQLGTFQFATRLLQQWRKDTHGVNAPPETVYFVGDTPESDIRGTNEFNESPASKNTWYSILVRTGVFQEGTKPAYIPKMTVDTVLDAVKHGLEREQQKAIKAQGIRAPPMEGAGIQE